MDPDALLETIRSMAGQIIDDEVPDSSAPEFLSELAQHFRDLDDWLSGDGFAPADWSRA